MSSCLHCFGREPALEATRLWEHGASQAPTGRGGGERADAHCLAPSYHPLPQCPAESDLEKIWKGPASFGWCLYKLVIGCSWRVCSWFNLDCSWLHAAALTTSNRRSASLVSKAKGLWENLHMTEAWAVSIYPSLPRPTRSKRHSQRCFFPTNSFQNNSWNPPPARPAYLTSLWFHYQINYSIFKCWSLCCDSWMIHDAFYLACSEYVPRQRG